MKGQDFDETRVVLHMNFNIKSPCALISELINWSLAAYIHVCIFLFSLKLNVYMLNIKPTQMLV